MMGEKKDWLGFFKHNLAAKVVSLLFSVLIWLIIVSQRNFEFVVNFDIKVKTAAQVTVQELSASKVELQLGGSKEGLKKITVGNWPREFILDLTQLEPGYHQVFIDSHQIHLPQGVEVRQINPRFIQVTLKPKALTK